MANYECVLRSNYFHVKDEESFRAFMNTVSGEDIHLWEEKDERDGSTLFGFGCYGSIYGVSAEEVEEDEDVEDEEDDEDIEYEENEDEDEENPYTLFLKGLQEHIADNDAVIICEAGNEKLRYVTGFATVITSDGIETISIDELAISKAREMLNNKDFNTKMDY